MSVRAGKCGIFEWSPPSCQNQHIKYHITEYKQKLFASVLSLRYWMHSVRHDLFSQCKPISTPKSLPSLKCSIIFSPKWPTIITIFYTTLSALDLVLQWLLSNKTIGFLWIQYLLYCEVTSSCRTIRNVYFSFIQPLYNFFKCRDTYNTSSFFHTQTSANCISVSWQYHTSDLW